MCLVVWHSHSHTLLVIDPSLPAIHFQQQESVYMGDGEGVYTLEMWPVRGVSARSTTLSWEGRSDGPASQRDHFKPGKARCWSRLLVVFKTWSTHLMQVKGEGDIAGLYFRSSNSLNSLSREGGASLFEN